jgi:multiple sugar transport system substrate-binding protein
MTEIEFSILANDHEVANRLRPIIAEFERQKRIKVTLTPVLWSEGWSAMANIALYGHGPDVSELGNSWVSTLAAMNALQVFSPETVRSLGGAEAFLKPAWQAGALRDERQAWSIPWLTYSQLLYYRKDVLEKVGLTDGAAALADPSRLEQTLAHLAAHGFPHALGLTTHAWAPIVHEAASWIWGAGGDFLSSTGRRAIFNQPEAFAGACSRCYRCGVSWCPAVRPRAHRPINFWLGML